ncbi:MAG: hypothetical protein SOR73_14015, partial [Romboutsia timonensis]|uniref:hypothetical protein n=1 Tax=Romboutsia timonensis TaxID=1776391 RepID=UPI002A7514E1
MSIDKLIYSDLMFGDSRADDDFESDVNNDFEFEDNLDNFLEESSIYEKEYYQYLDRLEKLDCIVNNINMYEINMIIDKWKPE